MSKPSPKHATQAAVQAQRPRSHEDDELHVPKGIPRWMSVLLIGLMIFLLVIFLVPDSLQNVFTGGRGTGNPVTVRWERPGHGPVEWLASDVQREERATSFALQADEILAYTMGINPNSVEPGDLVRILVIDQLARDAGVEVTDADLANHIRESLAFMQRTEDDFRAIVRGMGADQKTVEQSIRRLLRVARFQYMVGYAGGLPDPKKIEELWHQENVEFAFDYGALPVETLEEEARQVLPSSADLQVWFEKLPQDERDEFKTPELRKAQFALFRAAEVPDPEPLALTTAYPEKPAEGVAPTTPEELAHQYYNRTASRRFMEQRAEGEDATTEPADVRSFEEVQALCLAEAPLYFAMQRWLDDLKARKTAGETIDLRAEADELGLDFEENLEGWSEQQFGEPDVAVGGTGVAEAVFAGPADGSLHFSVVVGPRGMMVVRVTERTERAEQSFDVIHDKVAEKWIGPKSQELAEARLDALRKGFETFEVTPPEGELPAATEAHYRATGEAFRAAAQGAGLEVRTRDWLNKAGPASKDPQWEQEAHKALFGQANQFGLYQLENDEVAAPGLSMDEKTVYLVRQAGKREVPLENMSPAQYKRYKQLARSQASSAISQGMDLAFLRKNFGLWLLIDPDRKDAGEKDAPADAGKNG